MTASNSRFQKARTQTDFIEDINSDVKPPKKEVVTRNKSVIELEENKLSCSVRSRTKNGRNLTTTLFVEELELIEKAVSIKAEDMELSISAWIRKTLLDAAKKIVGKEEAEKILSNQLNVIKNK